jgi:hypothetical protein
MRVALLLSWLNYPKNPGLREKPFTILVVYMPLKNTHEKIVYPINNVTNFDTSKHRPSWMRLKSA